MLFSSIPFLFYFLPLVLIAYFAVPGRFKNLILLLASLFFYAWGEPKYVVLMLISIVQGYAFGLLIEKYRGGKAAKLFLSLSVLVSLGLLAYFKYADFFLSSVNAVAGLSLPLLKLALPIGISFYTFQVLSYVIDVYRGETAAQRSFIDLAAYVSLFPQLIAGPIVRYSDVAAELSDRTHSLSGAADGARRFVTGLCKKVLLANQFGALAAACKQSQEASVLFVWLYALAFLLQVYFDFSGYSDMAIGLGRILGFHFPENFNYPYISSSITEFWRRWHISLGSWFRDYLYIPLGGSRKGKARQLLNILIVWLATGLWHGAAWTLCPLGAVVRRFAAAGKDGAAAGAAKAPRARPHLHALFRHARLRALRRGQCRAGVFAHRRDVRRGRAAAAHFAGALFPQKLRYAPCARDALRDAASQTGGCKAAGNKGRRPCARCARAGLPAHRAVAVHRLFGGRVF